MFKSLSLKVIIFGFIFTFFSSFGQSFFLGLFNSSIRDTLSITQGQFGSIYATATLLSSFLLIWVGKKIDDINIFKFAFFVTLLLSFSCFFFSKISSIAFLFIAIFSNLGQYLWSGSARFGGMSGVIYGLLGYLWVHQWLAPNHYLFLPKELVGFMLLWLLICMSGALDYVLGIGVANAAHFIGLVTGMFLGLVFGFLASRVKNSNQ